MIEVGKLAMVKVICQIVLLLTSTVVIANVGWNVRLLLQSAQQTSTNIQRTSDEFQQYWTAQRGVIQSEKNQKAIEAALAVGATYQATGRLINTQVIPAILKQLEAGTVATVRLQGVMAEGERLVGDTNKQVNGRLLPEVTTQVKQLGELTKTIELVARGGEAQINTVTAALNELLNNGTITVQQLNTRLADPKLDEVVVAALSAVRHVDNTMASVDASAVELPPMFRFARKAQKPLTYLQILSVLARIFKPL